MSSPQATELVDPKSLITEAHVQATLKADKGTKAQLTSWTVEDFTHKGDNYATVVTSVKATFTLHGKENNVSYIVKLNHKRPYMKGISEFGIMIFHKESDYYEKIIPKLSSMLTLAGKRALRVPKWYYSSLQEEEEVIFLEDLRPRGFQMFDRKKGMDVGHATLVVQELARLHAASLLLQERSGTQELEDLFDFLKKDWTNFTDEPGSFLHMLFGNHIANAEVMLKKVGGYIAAEKWLARIKGSYVDLLDRMLVRQAPFKVICHGDCWNNNLLFRLVTSTLFERYCRNNY